MTDCGAVRCCRPRIRSRQTWPWPSRRRRLPSRSTPPFVEGSRQCPPQLLLWTFLRATRFLLVTADGCCGLQGGGALSSQLLTAIDAAGADRAGVQLYNYGGLDSTPSTMTAAQEERAGFWLLPMWAGMSLPPATPPAPASAFEQPSLREAVSFGQARIGAGSPRRCSGWPVRSPAPSARTIPPRLGWIRPSRSRRSRLVYDTTMPHMYTVDLMSLDNSPPAHTHPHSHTQPKNLPQTTV